VLELTGSSSKIVFHPLPQDDPKQRCPVISLAKSVLGWRPQVQLAEGLKKTIDYLDQLLREKNAQPLVGASASHAGDSADERPGCVVGI
jgi:UDP-glucuronate decarboxylase